MEETVSPVSFQYMNVMDVMDGAQEMPLVVTEKAKTDTKQKPKLKTSLKQ